MTGITVCNKCGTHNQSGAIYCSRCGVRIGSSAIGRFFLRVTKILAGIAIFAGLIIGIAFFATSGVANTVNDQLAAIRVGDYSKAYSYTSTEFQKNNSLEGFKRFIESIPALKNNQSLSINNRSFENDNGSVKGTITGKDGVTTPIEFKLVKENGTWKILEIHPQSPSD